MKHEIEQIKQNVHAINEARKVYNQQAKEILKVLKQYEGKQYLKANGELMKRFKEAIPLNRNQEITPLTKDGNTSLSLWIEHKYTYTVYLKVKVCYSGGNYEDNTYYCVYKDHSFELADANKSIITNIIDFEPKELIDVNEEITKFKEAIEIKKEYKKAVDKLALGSSKDLANKLYV